MTRFTLPLLAVLLTAGPAMGQNIVIPNGAIVALGSGGGGGSGFSIPAGAIILVEPRGNDLVVVVGFQLPDRPCVCDLRAPE